MIFSWRCVVLHASINIQIIYTLLKEYLIEYVGTKFDNESVTVNMIAETLAEEFPEFTMAFAEENFLRGYQLGLDDATRIPKAES